MENRFMQEGYESFVPGQTSPSKNPYDCVFEKHWHTHWNNGWRVAQAEHETGKGKDFDSKAVNCPWRDKIRCTVFASWCDEQNCAVWHFSKRE